MEEIKEVGEKKAPFLESEGCCPVCQRQTKFVSDEEYLRRGFRCKSCNSVPRERALLAALDIYFPQWRTLTIHESSPGGHGASYRLRTDCPGYLASQFWPDRELGSITNGVRCENLERLTFANDSIDLHISQDVMEHVFDPRAAFAEIARTLKPGGAHVFTVPMVNRRRPSAVRARFIDGKIEHLLEPQYHGNPISKDGALVVTDWGFDICQQIHDACGLFTHVLYIDDLSRGIRATLNQVLITVK